MSANDFATLEKTEETKKRNNGKLIAVITNNDDDVYCFRKELIEALAAEGYGILISCPYGDKLELMNHIRYVYDDPVIDRRGTNVFKDLKLYVHYKKLLKKYKPSAVLTFTAKPNVYAGMAARKYRIPYICNVTGLGSVLNKNALMKRFILWLFKRSYRKASRVMFQNSANMKLALSNGMVKDNYELIPGSGVDLERFPVQSYPDGGNGLEGDAVVFNYIGRILREKGVDDYIEAAKIIRRKYPETEFNMIGFIEPTENHYENKLKKLEEQGVVKYRGHQKDVRPWIARSHAIIHPSVYGEGISNVLLENAASGRPIITTDNPGCKETVVDGESGLLYTGGKVDELVKKIESFLAMDNADRSTMGLHGREHVENNYSRNLVIRAYKEEIGKRV